MKATPVRQLFLVGFGIVTLAAAAFGGWWLQDVRVEATWEPDWPQAVRITGESVEKIVAAAGGAASEGDRARAEERARWKAYYYAQLRAAEQLGSLEIAAETSIRDLTEMDQELETTFAGALRAAVEVDSATELLDDSVKARVTVEIPAEPMRDLEAVFAAALRAGRVSIERRPRPRNATVVPGPTLPVGAVEAPRPLARREEAGGTPALPAEARADTGATAAPRVPLAAPDSLIEPAAEEPTDDPANELPMITARGPAVGRPARPAPDHTGAAVRLAEEPYRLGVTSVLYELGGTEIGTVLDLPPERLTSGFFPIAEPGDADAIRRLAGASPRDLEATISGRDLFLSERLSAEEVRQMQQWLRAGKVVLVLG